MLGSRFFCVLLASLSLLGACQSGVSGPSQPTDLSHQDARVLTTFKVGAAPHGMAAAQGFVYNSNSGDGNLSLIDTSSDQVVNTLTLPSGKPGYLKATPQGSHILVLNPGSGMLHIFDPAQDHALLQSLELGRGPDKIAFAADGKTAYVSLTGEAAVVKLDFSAGYAQAPTLSRLPAGQPQADGGGHRSLSLGLSWLATPNPGDNDLSLIHSSSGEHQRIQAGNEPAALGLGSWDGADRMLMIGNRASHSLTLHHLETGLSQTLNEVGLSPSEILVMPELERAFVSMSGSNEVAVIDYRQQRLLGKIKVGDRPVHLYRAPALAEASLQHEGPESHAHAAPEIWVGNDRGDSVSVLDAQSLAVLATVPVGVGHHKMAFAGHKAYVSNISDGTITVIDRRRIGG